MKKPVGDVPENNVYVPAAAFVRENPSAPLFENVDARLIDEKSSPVKSADTDTDDAENEPVPEMDAPSSMTKAAESGDAALLVSVAPVEMANLGDVLVPESMSVPDAIVVSPM